MTTGDHLRHACALVRGVDVDVESRSSNHETTRRRILMEEEQDKELEEVEENDGDLALDVENAAQRSSLEPASGTRNGRWIQRDLKMSAVSYLLRRTLGVRSYVALGAGGEAVSTALGGDQKSQNIWSLMWGGSPAIKLASTQVRHVPIFRGDRGGVGGGGTLRRLRQTSRS